MSDEKTDESTEEVILIKEHHIPISKDHLLSTLLNKFESEKDKQSFGELASCIETLFYVNRIAKIEGFKQCYSCFSRLNEFKHNLSLSELSSRQINLMNMLYSILNDAHFEAITFEMYKNSIEKVFLSDLPIKVDWGKLDPNLLTEFYKKHPSQNPYKDLKLKPPFYQHFSMFYRGYGLNTMKGLFITPKLNIILADIFPIAQSLTTYVWNWYLFTVGIITPEAYEKTKAQKCENNENIPLKKSPQLDMVKLERISLLDTYNTAKSKGIKNILWWFLKNISIQEPTFKRLMLIYRQVPETFVAEQTRKLKEKANKLKSKVKKITNKKLGLKNQDEIDDEKQSSSAVPDGLIDEIGRKRKSSLFDSPELLSQRDENDTFSYPIRIKYFHDVPMSDLEITYPAKKFALKPMDNLYLTFTIFIGVWAIIQELLFSTDTTIGYWIVIVSIFLMIRSIFWYRATESEYVRVLNQALVKSNISSDQDTILSLIDNVDQQEFMETILAYFVILMNKNEVIIDSDGVDRLCEQFINHEFRENINVIIDGAMNKLSELGLFKSGNDESIKVKGLLDALSCVHSHYQSAIQTVRKINVNMDIVNRNSNNENNNENNNELSNNDDEKKSVDIVSKTEPPPIINANEISGDHFGNDNDEVQLID